MVSEIDIWQGHSRTLKHRTADFEGIEHVVPCPRSYAYCLVSSLCVLGLTSYFWCLSCVGTHAYRNKSDAWILAAFQAGRKITTNKDRSQKKHATSEQSAISSLSARAMAQRHHKTWMNLSPHRVLQCWLGQCAQDFSELFAFHAKLSQTASLSSAGANCYRMYTPSGFCVRVVT